MSNKRIAGGLLISGTLHIALASCVIFFLTAKNEAKHHSLSLELASFVQPASAKTSTQHSNKKQQTNQAKQQKQSPNQIKETSSQEIKSNTPENATVNKKPEAADTQAKTAQTPEEYKKHILPSEPDEYIRLNKAKVKEVVSKYQIYPSSARKSGCEGICTVSFKLHPNGNINEVRILKSSGFASLDKSALKALEDSAPELPRPNKPVTIVIPIEYIL